MTRDVPVGIFRGDGDIEDGVFHGGGDIEPGVFHVVPDELLPPEVNLPTSGYAEETQA